MTHARILSDTGVSRRDFARLVGIDPEARVDPAPAPGLVDNLGGEPLQLLAPLS